MQSFKILLDVSSGATNAVTVVDSSLELEGNYFAYDQRGLNKGVVTEFNVNQFLDNPENIDIVNDFRDYLTGNTTSKELQEIVNSNKKLADTFVNYYTTSITNGVVSPTSYIDNNLTGTTSISITNLNYNLEYASTTGTTLGTPETIIAPNARIGTEKDVLTTYTTEESIYLPVMISRNFVDIARINFTEFSMDCFKEVDGVEKFLKQCFVDLNKNNDPNSLWVTGIVSPDDAVTPDPLPPPPPPVVITPVVIVPDDEVVCVDVLVTEAKEEVWVCREYRTSTAESSGSFSFRNSVNFGSYQNRQEFTGFGEIPRTSDFDTSDFFAKEKSSGESGQETSYPDSFGSTGFGGAINRYIQCELYREEEDAVYTQECN